jgi:hypothetical protein
VLNGLYLLYTSQNLLGTIFGVTFTVFYRRIWNIVGKYSIVCCDIQQQCRGSVQAHVRCTSEEEFRSWQFGHSNVEDFGSVVYCDFVTVT